MGIWDAITGRSRVKANNLDALFNVPNAAITLQTAAGLMPTGVGSVCFRSAAGAAFAETRDDVVEPNLVWKDTVLVRTGETVDILLDVTNPGRWMAHCHIAEHHESGMMLSFNVDP